TAALIRGEDGPEWLQAMGLAGRFVATDGQVLRAGGWPEPAPEPAPGPEPDPGSAPDPAP
ncbi:MAG TPA: hypothetical protein VKR30_02795, partial [Candidatus Limnocylindrales bacterium]|nr:hypothetical protein [Candidatus Limnocylindrales bacterium]